MQDGIRKTTIPEARRTWGEPHDGWRREIYRVVFESDTQAGRLFDKLLVIAILASVIVVIADSVEGLHSKWYVAFEIAEWLFTALFTLEYLLRLTCLRRPSRYGLSFFGVIDLIAVLPTYLALLFPAFHVLIDIRILRLLRIFRIFKLTAYITEYQTLAAALAASSRKILVFLSVVVLIVVVMGSLMYVVEGPEHGFTSIPTSIYWAVTTMTTVGYGDITPQSAFGRFLTGLMMLLGWGTLAVPTGIVTSEIALRNRHDEKARADEPLQVPGLGSHVCPHCAATGHAPHAKYCNQCGALLPLHQA